MGKREYRILVISIAIFLTLCAVIFFVLHKKINIESITITKETICINLKCKNFSQNINEAVLENDNQYFIFEKNDIDCKITNTQMIVVLNCANKTIHLNQQYKLMLKFSGGYVTAKLILKNANERNDNTFPCEDYETVRIVILDESSVIGM